MSGAAGGTFGGLEELPKACKTWNWAKSFMHLELGVLGRLGRLIQHALLPWQRPGAADLLKTPCGVTPPPPSFVQVPFRGVRFLAVGGIIWNAVLVFVVLIFVCVPCSVLVLGGPWRFLVVDLLCVERQIWQTAAVEARRLNAKGWQKGSEHLLKNRHRTLKIKQKS